MSAPTNHWKLGAFVMGSVLLGAICVAVLGARAFQTQTVSYRSYFDEQVTGLQIGSPISFRGVKIGDVSGIDIAPDRRHVEITYELGTKVLGRLGLAGTTTGSGTRISVPDNLRVQLGSSGLTGTKFLQLDFFDVTHMPVPTLPFEVPENYIPATPSTMKNVEEAVIRGVEMLPVLTAKIAELLGRVDMILADVHGNQLPQKAAMTITSANETLLLLKSKLHQLNVDELSGESTAALKNVNVILARLDKTLERVDGENGLVASIQRVSDSVGDVTGGGLDRDLESTLREVREAAVGIRRLVDALERDPDMLLKGKGQEAAR